MKNYTSKFKLSQRGFTLIELLVVIAVITLISGIVMTSVAEARNKANNTKQLADYRTITGALIQFKQDKGYYPAIGNQNICIGTYQRGGCLNGGALINSNGQANTELQKYISSLSFLENSAIYKTGIFPPLEYSGFMLTCNDATSNYGECADVVIKFPALKTADSCPTILTEFPATKWDSTTNYILCSVQIK